MSTLTPRQGRLHLRHSAKTLGKARLSGDQKKESPRTSGGGVNMAGRRVWWSWWVGAPLFLVGFETEQQSHIF